MKSICIIGINIIEAIHENESMTPLISVITPFFNVDLFLEEAINSVRNQDYTNWEMILIDDGSTDESSRIAKEYALAYPGKIIYTSHSGDSNKGASASRNHGISISSGSLVAFIDADDVWLEGKLSAQVKLLSDYPQAVMVCEASQYWESWQPTGKKDRLIMVGKEQNKLFPPPQLAEKLYPLGEGFAPCPSSIIIRRSILEKYSFEENFKGIYQLYEDQVFLLKVYLNEVVFISSQCNNRYRLREGSCVQRVN
ncbi:MAG: glycosyltransferase family 2 protein, partial [Chitinophagaceae bacterium]